MVSSVASPGKAVVTPAAEARIIYVSASTGDDANDGLTPESAVQSIVRGEQLVRDCSPDWLLLKRGDRWQAGLDDWHKRGRSPEQPMIIGAYGTGPRPLMKSATAFAPELSLEFVTVIGVQFVADARLRAAASAASAAAAFAARQSHSRPPGVVRRAPEPDRPPFITPPGHAAYDVIVTDPADPPRRASPQPGQSPQSPATRIDVPRIFSDTAAVAAIIPSPAEALRPVRPAPPPAPRRGAAAGSLAPPTSPKPANRLGGLAPLAPLATRLSRSAPAQPLRVKRIALGRDDASLVVTFTSNIAAGIDRCDLLLASSDGQTIDPTALSVTCDPTGRVATWTFPGLAGKVLPAGSYRVTLRAAITDESGQQLDGHADGIGGDDYVSPRRVISRGNPPSATIRTYVEPLPRRAAA